MAKNSKGKLRNKVTLLQPPTNRHMRRLNLLHKHQTELAIANCSYWKTFLRGKGYARTFVFGERSENDMTKSYVSHTFS